MFGIVFTRIKGDRGEYVQSKLHASSHGSVNFSEEDVAAMISAVTGDELPLSDLKGLEPKPEQLAVVDARRRCALRNLSTNSPLLEGEVIEEDFFSFLTEPFDELPIGTAILRRTTNMAVLYYLFPDFQVSPQLDLVYNDLPEELARGLQQQQQAPEPEHPPLLAAGGQFDIGDISKKICTGLLEGIVGSIGEAIGAMIFELIFPPSVPSYFDEVYKEITKIVKQELQQHDIDLIEAQINGVLKWQRDIYTPKNPRKETNPHEREKLFDEVVRKIEELNTSMSILTNQNWKDLGISVFAVAGGVYLGLCQEACLMDYKVSDPRKSSYAQTIQLTAAEYADSIRAAWEEVLKKRKEQVYVTWETSYIQIARKFFPSQDYRWVDPIAETKGKLHGLRKKDDKTTVGNPKKEAEDDMKKYRDTLPAVLSKKLGDPLNIADQWSALVNQVLPAKATSTQ